MNPRAAVVFLVLCVGALLVPSEGRALTAVERSFDDLVALADVIVVGTVSNMQSTWRVGELHRGIVTDITLSDLSVIKGQITGNEYKLRVSGGIVGRTAQVYPGAPQFAAGNKYVLFVRGNNHEMFPLVGIGQGVFQVVRDAKRREIIADERGAPIRGVIDARVISGSRALLSGGGVTVEEFVAAIRVRLPSASAEPAS